MVIYPIGATAAIRHAAKALSRQGCTLIDHPAPEVTHLLLDVPSFSPSGKLRNGSDLTSILQMLPPHITVIGGNLDHPALADHQALDLLKLESYLAPNAAITAECALQAAAQHMTTVFSGTPILVIGWGRIGKCLAKLLHSLGADLTVAARKESDRAMLTALGHKAIPVAQTAAALTSYRAVFNTVPAPVLPPNHPYLSQNCPFLDLASSPGFDHPDVIPARGLPGLYAPESSGNLIAKTILSQEASL